MAFLYDTVLQEFGKREIARTTVPNSIQDHLKHTIRPYQKEAFQRFILCYNEDFDGKPNRPLQLMYNMATGSGKTLVMAGLMLYLYEKGYRHFLFFVNTNNIINKTKENFLNPQATKYLFGEKIVIEGKQVQLKAVTNFDEADEENININFTTIQQLHIDLNNTKENSLTFEDFRDKKIVLIADEAHHLSAATKNNSAISGSWEGTVLEILKQNYDNILLEFTATIDYESREIAEKYQDKVIQKYDLAQFRMDKYSKEINLVRSLYDEKERIIQALILNLYRQELATAHHINLKPVILFKAKKTIKESEQNKRNFHDLIDTLTGKTIENILQTSTIHIVQKAFAFFESIHLSPTEISSRIQSNFKVENCISANNDKEAALNQIRLNTLEDENNPIRAVFAVQKLNEGWDVLNLFDIVRLYEGQNTGGSNKSIGKTTLSEAQLIGRGARYFPFKIDQDQDLYKRKYDAEISNDLKILEELYYHTKDENRYISELKKALIESGIYEDEDKLETKKLNLKATFKATDFYQKGHVIFNKRVEKSYDNVKSFADLGISKQNYTFKLSSGFGQKSGIFGAIESETKTEKTIQKDIAVASMPKHVIRYALTQNAFFYFDRLIHYFPNLEAMSSFMVDKNFLGGLEITFSGTETRLAHLSNADFLKAIQGLLAIIAAEIKSNATTYEGSGFFHEPIKAIFKNKEIRVFKDSERSKGQTDLVEQHDWYAYNANYGTIEEKKFVEMFARRFENLEKSFEKIYLIRNERAIKIIDKLGRAFEPDFLLFCKQKKGKELTFQVFIEPKGGHLKKHDKWKENFLKLIRDKNEVLKINSDEYLITGVPFYNYQQENEFKDALEKTLNSTD